MEWATFSYGGLVTISYSHAILALLLFSTIGCANPPEGITAKPDPNSDKTAFWPVYGAPISLPGSQTLLIPLGIDSYDAVNRVSFGLSSGFVSGGSSMSGGWFSTSGPDFDSGNIHWNNVVFYDTKTGESHLLLDRRAVICRYIAPQVQDQKVAKAPRYLLFAIADSDTNGDGVINEKDALILYVCDPSGHNLIPVTPAMTQFQNVTADADDSAIYVQIAFNVRSDHQASADDPTRVLRIDPLHPAMGKPIFDDELTKKAFHIVVP